jgi:hypothetical protein
MPIKKTKSQSTVDEEFRIPLKEALLALLADEDVGDGDSWSFQVYATELAIYRKRPPQPIPIGDEPAPTLPSEDIVAARKAAAGTPPPEPEKVELTTEDIGELAEELGLPTT